MRNPFARRKSNPSASDPFADDRLNDLARTPVTVANLHPGDIIVCDEGEASYLGGGLVLLNGSRVALGSLGNPEFYRD